MVQLRRLLERAPAAVLATTLATASVAGGCGGTAGPAREQPEGLVFMEPADTTGAPIFVRVSDSVRLARFRAWADNPSARWAVELYRAAVDLADPEAVGGPPLALHVALVPGGNHADGGFRLISGTDTVHHPSLPYVRIGPDPWRFRTTLLHETGHAVLRLLNGGEPIAARSIAALTHATPALTDRGTAFNEGYAIHLETVVAHLEQDPDVRGFYDRAQRTVGRWPEFEAEFYAPMRDLLTFAQAFGRYADVRDNAFAFSSAFEGPDYLRVQLDPARDRSRLRSPDQLLQSEGFYATYFFTLVTRGNGKPSVALAQARQRETLTVLARVLRGGNADPERPYLLDFVDSYLRVDEQAGTAALDALLDLSHGVFVDPEARDLWRRLYLGALGLDRTLMQASVVEDARDRWRAAALADPSVLRSRLGPQIRCEVAEVPVRLPALEWEAPLSFDANTVQGGVLEGVPGISDHVARSWLEERERAPFRNLQDLEDRVGVDGGRLGLTCDGGPG